MDLLRNDIDKLTIAKTRNESRSSFWIEFIKILSAGVFGGGGIVAAINGYQIAEIKSQNYDLEIKIKENKTTELKKEIDNLTSKLYELKNQSEKKQQDLTLTNGLLAQVEQEIKDSRARLDAMKGSTASLAESKAISVALQETAQVELKITAANYSSKATQRSPQDTTYYYVIALTTSTKSDADAELSRVKKTVGARFEQEFPDARTYAPNSAGTHVVLASARKLPYAEANALKRRAIEAGFNKETWLWQSTVPYFSAINP